MFATDIGLEYTRAEKVILAVTGLVPIVLLSEAVLSGQVELPLQPTATDPVSILLWIAGLLVLAIGTVFTLAWKHVTGKQEQKLDKILDKIDQVYNKVDDVENEVIRNGKR